MLKRAVAFAAGIVLIFPSFARADETSESTAQKPAVDIKNAIESRASGESWLRSAMPLELAGEKECDGKSVDDFLKGKCNKLHGFDLRPGERGNGKLPPAWGGDEFTKFVPMAPEASGRPGQRFGNELPYYEFEPRFRVEFPSGDKLPPLNECPKFEPRESVPAFKPVEK
ncbi:MAG: hypothetical protein DKT66_12860 [Candidatus Melainabacteria bacterium]|nr:MAG: hypothetical protein DKT66_12860 [Candidatus Melainabacteria bacterium]